MNRKATSVSAVIALIAIAGFTSQAVSADDFTEKEGWYIGGGIGKTYTTIDKERIESSLQANGFTMTDFSADDSDSGYKLFAGYQFNRNFALEGGYFDLGTHGFTATTDPAGTLTGEIDVRGINLDAVGFLPLFGESFSLLGRVGMNYAEAEDHFSSTGAVNVLTPNPSNKGLNYKVGLGGQWDFNSRVAMRLEYERYRIDDAVSNKGDIDLASIGLLVRFGGKSEPAPRARPVPVIVPATEEYCSILDIQFEIDADTIQREEEERLQVLGTYLQKYPDTTAVIEGHSDNVGSSADNLRLSLRRAESVVDFLIRRYDIDASRLSAVGHGEARPIASNDTQDGQRKNRRIGAVISCVDDIVGLEPVPARITMAMLIEFAHDDAVIDRRYHSGLKNVADYLKENPSVTATIEGHTGNATPARSHEIARLRAQNVMNYLVQNFDIPRWRLNAEGFGETRRFSYNTTAEGRQENRRVNIIFNYPR